MIWNGLPGLLFLSYCLLILFHFYIFASDFSSTPYHYVLVAPLLLLIGEVVPYLILMYADYVYQLTFVSIIIGILLHHITGRILCII